MGSPAHGARIAAELGHAALAQTNHGNINGALAHRKACQEQGIIPIVGCETYWRPDHTIREKEWRYRRWHMVLLAKNLRGWHNLIRITSAAFSEGFYQDPCISPALEEKYSEGLICTTACVLGPLAFLIENGTDAQVDEWVQRALKTYGDDLFFSIMPNDFDRQRMVNLAIVSIANRHGCPIIYEGDSHYPEDGWVDTQKVAILTGMNKTYADAEAENQKRIEAGDEVYELWHEGLHIMGEDEVRKRFADFHPDLPSSIVDEAIDNTDEILRRVEPYLMDRSLKMPQPKGGIDAKAQVLKWCREGLKRIGKEGDEVYEDRLIYEAQVIDERDAWPYFLLVGEFVRWARSQKIRINTRGSAAASLICYTTQISMLDPIAHRFKFERFINPERKSLPDIDIDIASSRREECKQWFIEKGSVADIVAYQHFQPRAALKAVAKTMYGYDSNAFKEVSVLTHQDTGVIDPMNDTDLEAIREREHDLDGWAKTYPVAWMHAVRLENHGDPSVLRLSKHAAGIAVLPGDIADVMPTIKASEEEIGVRTAWSETSRVSIVDELGIVKVDLLGLAGLDQQQKIVEAVEANTGEHIELDLLPPLSDPYDVDPEIMDLFRRGLMLGINQFAGDGVREYLQKVAPDNLVDITAVNALYRPGPIGSGGHNRFAKRKHGEEYSIPEILQPILEDTHGCLVFQEQVMEIFQVLVGYSAGQADDIRKEIDKLNRAKNREGRARLNERKGEFIEAATAKLGSVEAAEEIWSEILPYTGYAFNRPHAGSYSTHAYQDAWLKVKQPLDFFAVLLTMEEKKTALILREAREFDMAVLPPDINASGNGFTADRSVNAIRYGLRGIKGIGDAAADQVLADRPFASLEDFMERSSRKYSKVNKKSRELLLRVGALDCFGAREGWTPKDRALSELELLGVSLDPGGVLGDDAPIVRESVYSEEELEGMNDGDTVIVGGAVVEAKKVKVKRGRQAGRDMAHLRVALDLDQYRVTCFPDVWAKNQELIESGVMVIVTGQLDSNQRIKASKMMPLQEFIDGVRAEQEVAA